MSAVLFVGEQVEILTSGGGIDPFIYAVHHIKGDLVDLTCQETGITIKVNQQRISKVIKKDKKAMNSHTTIIDEAVIETPEFSEVEIIETLKGKISNVKDSASPLINFDEMVQNGYEVWTKIGLTLGKDSKVSGIQVSAHCVIDPIGTQNYGFEVFNSYNGTRGKKGNTGKRYRFTEKMDLEKKRRQLEKRGYFQHTL